jgi:hypothetical protein
MNVYIVMVESAGLEPQIEKVFATYELASEHLKLLANDGLFIYGLSKAWIVERKVNVSL